MTARRPPFALVLGALVAGAVLWSLGGLEPHDESWFLQVTDRVAGGETLYEDVAYGATPLAVYLLVPLVWLFGAQILWVKALVVGCFVASLLLLVSIGRRVGATNLELAAGGVALLVWSPPIRAALYQPLATTLLLAALAAMLAWRDSRATRTVVLAGALAGLAFAAKQNVGAYAGLAVVAAALVAGGSGRIRAATVASGAFAATVVLTLVPVLATGGLRGFWDYGFASKGEYVNHGDISYVGRVREPALRRALPGARDRRRGHGGRARLRAGGVRPRAADPPRPRRRLASHARGAIGPASPSWACSRSRPPRRSSPGRTRRT